jgi:hypothetical protein
VYPLAKLVTLEDGALYELVITNTHELLFSGFVLATVLTMIFVCNFYLSDLSENLILFQPAVSERVLLLWVLLF